MEFLYWDVQLGSNDAVLVSLDSAANVLLLDPANFSRYRRGEDFTYYGGSAKASPVCLGAPHAGSWHVVVDLGGHAGSVRAGLRVIRH